MLDKFNCLKAQLKGTASKVICGLELTQENYNIAINLLKESYGKKQIMIKTHFAKLMNLPMATYKTTSLRTFYDTMEKHMRCLQSLGEDDNNTQILTVLQLKPPLSVLLQLERKKRKNRWMDSEEIQGNTASSYFNAKSLRFANEVVDKHRDG